MKHDELVHLLETKYGLKTHLLTFREDGSCEFNLDRKYFGKNNCSFARFYRKLDNNPVWEFHCKVSRNYNPDAIGASATIGDLKWSWDEIEGEIDITEEDVDLRWQMLNESYDEFVDIVSKLPHIGQFEITHKEKQKIYSAIKLYDYMVENPDNVIAKKYIKDIIVNKPMEDSVYIYTYVIEPLRTKFSSTGYMRTIILAGDVEDVHVEGMKMKNLFTNIIDWSVDYAGYVVINGEKFECDYQPKEVKEYILKHSKEFEEPDYNKIMKEYQQKLMLNQIEKEFE
jgi:hypothetical protein